MPYNAAGMGVDRGDELNDALVRRATELGRALERARFGGANPVVEVPAGASALEAAASVLAAERANALLRLDGRLYNTREDRAEADLGKALAALRAWSFGAAEALLDAAEVNAAEPSLQQRIALWKLLAQLVRRVVMTDPDEGLRGHLERWALEHLEHADRLLGPERAYYRAEVERLVGAHAAARRADQGPKTKDDRRPTTDEGAAVGPAPRSLVPGPSSGADAARLARNLWYLLRARLALARDEPLPALAWCVRAATAGGDAPPPDGYVGDLLDRGRRYVLLQMGELTTDEAVAAREATKGLQAWDVYHALAAELGRRHGLDAHRETARWAIAPYQGEG